MPRRITFSSRPKFSLLAMFLAITLLAIPCAYVGHEIRRNAVAERAFKQHRAWPAHEPHYGVVPRPITATLPAPEEYRGVLTYLPSSISGLHDYYYPGLRAGIYAPSVDDDFFTGIEAIQQLSNLAIPDSQVTDAGAERLRFLRHLELVCMTNCPVGDATVHVLSEMPELRDIYLSGTLITDSGIGYLTKLKTLEYLNLNRTKITDASVKALINILDLPGFQELDVTDTSISAAGMEQLWRHESEIRDGHWVQVTPQQKWEWGLVTGSELTDPERAASDSLISRPAEPSMP